MFNLLNLFFPPYCINCDCVLPINTKKWLCLKCVEELSFIKEPLCKKCGAILTDNNICLRCKNTKFLFDKSFSPFDYNSNIKQIIHNLKFYNRLDSADTLGGLMYEYLVDRIDFNEIDLIIPVPMFFKKKRNRGYNQAEALAKGISTRASICLCTDVLLKIKETEVQSLVPSNDRALNVLDAYDTINNQKVSDKKVLLVDDVFTTGSTINECSKVLLKARAKSIIVVSLAITTKSSDSTD